MKLNKLRLIKLTKDELNKLGYILLKDIDSGANGLYGKLISPDLFLTLGLVISRYYDAKFTASFYLSKTTIWSAIWGDIPRDSYERVSVFLTREEREIFLSEEYTQEGVVDAWWNDSVDSISSFVNTVKITENRFIEQNDLLDRIEKSAEVNRLQDLSFQVIKQVNSSKNGEIFNYKFIPAKGIGDIPLEWFETAERVLLVEGEILNVNTVKRLAADAWTQEYIRNRKN
jgi:hypothetical protein